MLHYTALALHSFSMNVQKPKKKSECASARRTVGPNSKNPPEIEVKKKSVKLTDHTYAYYSLTIFGREAYPFTGNGNSEICFEKLMKSH